ncbi:MAG: hypothetical protein J0L92_41345, partial [Deltaproteobacteria bacterium]|nr:hypothetical protein [Deltaproteobacteria bacterium]
MPDPVRPPSTAPIEPTPALDRRLAAVTLRARVQRGIVALPPLATGLGAGLVCVFLARDLGALSQRDAIAAALVASIVAILAVVVAALRPLEPLTIAVMLDRAL